MWLYTSRGISSHHNSCSFCCVLFFVSLTRAPKNHEEKRTCTWLITIMKWIAQRCCVFCYAVDVDHDFLNFFVSFFFFCYNLQKQQSLILGLYVYLFFCVLLFQFLFSRCFSLIILYFILFFTYNIYTHIFYYLSLFLLFAWFTFCLFFSYYVLRLKFVCIFFVRYHSLFWWTFCFVAFF